MKTTDAAFDGKQFEFETSIEQLEEILAPTPSIPIPPPFR